MLSANGEIIGGWERPCTGTHVGHRLAVVPEALSAGGRAHWPTAVHRQLGILFFWFGPASFSALGGCCVPGAMEQIDTVEGHHVATMLVSCECGWICGPGPQQPQQPIPGCSPLPPVTFDAPTFWVAKQKVGTAARGPKAISKMDLTSRTDSKAQQLMSSFLSGKQMKFWIFCIPWMGPVVVPRLRLVYTISISVLPKDAGQKGRGNLQN
ncbi:hypothetical protein EDB83DRAFT_1982430 [Lactarius deliciosus]|nr:hypothetical protein EDB83DRAFT_1982430 [Lactarius deliciosus]